MSEKAPPHVAVLTVSDRCARGEATDEAGPAVAERATSLLGAAEVSAELLPDDRTRVAERLRAYAEGEPAADLLLTTGGTGLGPRDVTPEATRDVLERPHAGLVELARRRTAEQTPLAYLSRGEAGAVRRTLVVNLPGSTKGALEHLDALADVLPHALAMLRGGGHPEHGAPPHRHGTTHRGTSPDEAST